MKALSIKQPWAWLILHGYKDVESREWSTRLRGRVLVHAGGSRSDMTRDVMAWILKRLDREEAETFMAAHGSLPFGALVGEVDITACVSASRSPWFAGPCGFILANPVAYDKPIPYKGQRHFFEVKL
ncbi:MAG: ASCH domain-containing protein [Chloroflexi bacterium]|nr:ASCH domain-containing protein [Chloroflexota bacterium]